MIRLSTFLKGHIPYGLFFIIAVTLCLALSCRSQGDPYAEDLTAKEYFQRAIEASDRNNYRLAQKYYEVYLSKFPDDLHGNLWASYEIAFCYYKMKKNRKAVELFEQLLERYEALAKRDDIDPDTVPEGPRILTELVLEKIRKRSPKIFEGSKTQEG
jgi:tetratricopeptide (TPR) repeat protein